MSTVCDYADTMFTNSRAAPIGSVSHSFSLWKRLYTNRYYIILMIVTYTMISCLS